MKKGLLIFIFSCFTAFCFAQNANVAQERIAPKPKKAEKGTYQFIADANDTTSVFTEDILVVIESLRDRNKVVYYDASPTVKVMILPQVDIDRPGFHPLPEWSKEKEN